MSGPVKSRPRQAVSVIHISCVILREFDASRSSEVWLPRPSPALHLQRSLGTGSLQHPLLAWSLGAGGELADPGAKRHMILLGIPRFTLWSQSGICSCTLPGFMRVLCCWFHWIVFEWDFETNRNAHKIIPFRSLYTETRFFGLLTRLRSIPTDFTVVLLLPFLLSLGSVHFDQGAAKTSQIVATRPRVVKLTVQCRLSAGSDFGQDVRHLHTAVSQWADAPSCPGSPVVQGELAGKRRQVIPVWVPLFRLLLLARGFLGWRGAPTFFRGTARFRLFF